MENLPAPSSEAPLMAKPLWPWIFRNERGLRSGWRLTIYLCVFAALWIGAMLLIQALRLQRDAVSPWVLLLGESVTFCAAFGAAWMMSRFESRSVGAYGLPARGAFGKLFWLGCVIGLCEISALMGLIAAFGGYSFGELALHGSRLAEMAVSWAIFFVFVGLLEEFLFRGYTQFTLADGIGFWPAALILSASFGLVHLRNPGEGWVGAASVFAIGMIFCLALKRTGSLWFCVGLHAAFDFGETFLYSVPDSGFVFKGHLSNATLHGPSWLTGGSVGPEGTVFSFLTMGLVALVIHVFFPAKPASPAEVAAAPIAQ